MTIIRFVALALALTTAPLLAHDMWIEPTSFNPAAGKIIGLKLRVGENFIGDPIPRDPNLIDQFISVDSTGRRPVYGREGADPGLMRVADPGLLVFGYQSRPSPIVVPFNKFNQYLKEEGLDAIAELRARRNQTDTAAREIFSRCAKSLVSHGMPTSADADRVLGFTLELVAEKNPYLMKAGQDLPVSLTYEGRPLQGVQVVAMNRANPKDKLIARTDKRGRVTFRLSDDGTWLVKAVHMIPAHAGTNAEWASFWASLTFELGTRAAASASPIGRSHQ